MIVLIQRVAEASVSVEGRVTGAVGRGLLALVCGEPGDTPAVIGKLARKTARLRIFEDEAGRMNRSVVDGPLSLDVALYKEVAEHKKVKGSSVAGDPDCLLFPNLESANVFFKSVSHLCGGELAAMVMGTKVPCVLTSRGDTSKTKLFSIALACLAVKK